MNKKQIFQKSSRQAGFTLIELLVVIAIIGLLSTLAVVALNNARQKSRDAKRVSDIKQIQTALELYYNDVTGYPTDVTVGSSIDYNGTTYMSIVPSNPTPVAPGNPQYAYTVTGTGNSGYVLTYTLEGSSGGVSEGTHTATPAGIATP
jgi:prepilin-type N-terminal cleavage/methylation domain-containing protein